MEKYIARANIDHYLGLLHTTGLGPENRAVVTQLLIQEEDKFAHDLEQLQFAEDRAANGRNRLHNLRNKLDLVHPEGREQAERLIANVEAIQELMEGFCHRLRAKASSRL